MSESCSRKDSGPFPPCLDTWHRETAAFPDRSEDPRIEEIYVQLPPSSLGNRINQLLLCNKHHRILVYNTRHLSLLTSLQVGFAACFRL